MALFETFVCKYHLYRRGFKRWANIAKRIPRVDETSMVVSWSRSTDLAFLEPKLCISKTDQKSWKLLPLRMIAKYSKHGDIEPVCWEYPRIDLNTFIQLTLYPNIAKYDWVPENAPINPKMNTWPSAKGRNLCQHHIKRVCWNNLSLFLYLHHKIAH
jgi:hypothetical protein